MKIALTRAYQETVMARTNRARKIARARYAEALSAIGEAEKWFSVLPPKSAKNVIRLTGLAL